MRRGSRFLLPLAALGVLAASCGQPTPPPLSPARRPVDPATAIAVSVLADTIYLVDPDTGDRAVVAGGLRDFRGGFAAWAPDHRRLAYGDGGIVLLDTERNRRTVLVARDSLSMPAWSPDGTRIAYGDGRTLWVTPADRLSARYVPLPLDLGPLGMAWHPGGAIAFQGLELECRIPRGCSSTGRSDLWTVLPDGAGLARLTRVGHAGSPRWSPDGGGLLFVRRQAAPAAGGELWMVSAAGGRLRRLTGWDDVVAADWSPDGSRLAVLRATRAGELRLWVAGSRGGGARPVGQPFPGAQATIDW